MGIKLRKRSLLMRAIVAPTVFCGHFRIMRKGGSRWWIAASTSAALTYTHVFWRG